MKLLKRIFFAKKNASAEASGSGEAPWLINKTLHRQGFVPTKSGDHEHCEFCWQRISACDGDDHEGYTDDAQYHWVCMACWEERHNEYQWKERCP